jgi:hypothetical protein
MAVAKEKNELTKIEVAEKKVEVAKARLQQQKAKDKTAARKLETRGKIILGALLIKKMNESKEVKNGWLKQIEKMARDKDRDLLISLFF